MKLGVLGQQHKEVAVQGVVWCGLQRIGGDYRS